MDSTFHPGSKLGSYELEALIGRGGMGAVYRAVHSKLGRKVAIKVLAPELAADAQYVSRFFHEAKVVNAVRHPNIVDVYDFLELDEPKRVAYVMELIEGPSLGAVLKERRLLPIQAVNVILQLASALEAVHRLQVVHRDLKPDNILLVAPLDSDFSEVPNAKILDFGIAKVADPDRAHKTGTGFMLGTPAYMSPEQIGGESVTDAADTYAIGEILYETLVGQRLFKGEMRTIFKHKLTGERPPIALPDDVGESVELRTIIDGCTQVDPARRPTLSQVRAVLLGVRDRLAQSSAEAVARTPPRIVVPGGNEPRADTAPRLLDSSVVESPAAAAKSSLRRLWIALAILLPIAMATATAFFWPRSDAIQAVPLNASDKPAEPPPPAPAPPAKAVEPVKPVVPAKTESKPAADVAKKAPAIKKSTSAATTKKPPPKSTVIKKEELPTW